MALDVLETMTACRLDATADRARAETLAKVPAVSSAAKVAMLAAALKAAQSTSTLGVIIRTMRGPGRLIFDEICYCRLLDGDVAPAAMQRFGGKKRQIAFHLACNDAG